MTLTAAAIGIAVQWLSLEAIAEAKEPEWSYLTENNVDALALSSDGEYVVAASRDRIYFMDTNRSEPPLSYQADEDFNDVAISGDGEYIAASSDGYVYLFMNDDSDPLWSDHIINYVYCVAISTDGNYLVSGGSDDRLRLYHKDNSTPVWSALTDGNIDDVAISSDGKYIVAGTDYGYIYLHDKDSSTPIWSYDADYDINSIAISADGEYIVAGSANEKLYVFDKDSSTPLWSYQAESAILTVSISTDGEYIAAGSGGFDRTSVYLFKRSSSTPIINYETQNYVYSVSLSSDGRYLGAATAGDKLYLFNKNNSAPLWTFETEYNDMNVVSLSANGKKLASGSDNDTIYFFANNMAPTASIDSLGPSPAEEGSLVVFEGSGDDPDGTVEAYLWSSSLDGQLSTEGIFSSSSLSLGTHQITLKVQDEEGKWSEQESIELKIYAQPIAEAGVYEGITKGQDIDFIGQGSDKDGTIVLFEWDFEGDEVFDWSSSNNGQITHTYNDFGIFLAKLRVTDNDGYTAFDTTEIMVIGPPTAYIDSVDPDPAEKGAIVNFEGSGEDSDGTLEACSWTSSIDGEISTNMTFSTSDLSMGTHEIMFKVLDDDSLWSGQVATTLVIFTRPVVFAGNDTTIVPDSIMQFNGQAFDDDGSIVLYEWDFDNNGIYDWRSNTTGITTFIFNLEGAYSIVLKVTDNDGHSNTDTIMITVQKEPISEPNSDNGPAPSILLSIIAITISVFFIKKRG